MIRPTPIPYVGKKSKYLHMISALLGTSTTKGLIDLTAGSSTVPLFFCEHYNFTHLHLNDVSRWAELVARAYFDDATHPLQIRKQIQATAPLDGYVCLTPNRSLFSRDAARWIDGFCCLHQANPTLLIALSCVILKGATRFSQIVKKYTLSLSPKQLAEDTERVAIRIAERRPVTLSSEFTADNYLALPARYDGYNDWVVYLDPAWPGQLNRKTHGNDRIYGLDASTVMSMLAQDYVPLPDEYSVPAPMFWAGMRNTIERMAKGNKLLVAYQTNEDEIDEVEGRLFDGLRHQMLSADKNASSTLREYLFYVEDREGV